VERGERNLTLENIAAFSKHSDFLRRSCSRRLKRSSTSDETGYLRMCQQHERSRAPRSLPSRRCSPEV
jgi:hypothetical protein